MGVITGCGEWVRSVGGGCIYFLSHNEVSLHGKDLWVTRQVLDPEVLDR